jgi:polysaccharide biosynthesis transport protein
MTAPDVKLTPDVNSRVLGAFKLLRKHWALIVAGGILTSGAVLLYSKSQHKVYQATTLLEIDPRPTQVLGDKQGDVLDMGAGSYWDTRDYYETQYKIIASERVLSSVVRELGLASDPDFRDPSQPTSKTPTVEDATLMLAKRVSVEPVRMSRLIYIHVDDTDPKRAKRICDAIASDYIDENLQNALSSTSDAVTWLSGQVDHIKGDLEHTENALYDFKQRNDLPSTSINEASNMLRVEMQELDTALTHTRTKRQELLARYGELSKVSADNPDDLPASELLASTFLQSLRTQYQDAVKEHGALAASGKGENHPLVRSASEKVTETKAALLSEVRNIQGAVERDLAIVTREEAGEDGLFEVTRKRAVDLNMKEIEYHRLDRSREENEKLYSMLLGRLKEADLARMMKMNNIRVVDFATEPRFAIRPRWALNTGIGLLVGLLLATALAWLREQLDSSLKTPAEIDQELGIAFLGLLPEMTARDSTNGRRKRRGKKNAPQPAAPGVSELVVHHHPLSGIAEAARSIRTNIMFMNPDRPYHTLLVTSAAPSEGKTTVACSIAIALAQSGQRVCLVDCDLRRPRIHRIFDRAGESGVTNVLVGEAALEDVAKPTEVENLWAIPAGPTPPNPADMLQSERFRRFLADLSARFDRVILDSPPIVAVTDSAIISRLVDGTVFVVRAFKTSKHLSAQGLRTLRDVDATVVGAVLNAVNLDRQEYSYYYHYYYYKREGYRAQSGRDDDTESPLASPPN